MKLSHSPALQAFRDKIRSYFENDYPQDILAKVASGASLNTAEVRRAEMALGERGWLASAWPEEHGGPGWSIEQQYIFDEELERAGAPTVTPMGVIYVGPVIYTFGNEQQKAQWLPGLRDGSVGWAQGYSEPEAGSDLASLQFSAVRDGDEYVLNGTKIWTSAAQHADWIFLLTRTSREAKKQMGITFICCKLDQPGVTVKPIITIDGKYYLSQCDFVDVRVPVGNRIGEEGKGWSYSQYLLGNERTSYARIGGKRKQMENIRAIASQIPTDGNQRLIDDRFFAGRLSEAETRLDALEITVLRVLTTVRDGGSPGDEASILKIMATDLAQEITTLFLEAAAEQGNRKFADSISPEWTGDAAFAAPGVATYFGTRAQSIYGGTNEIQRNIIAKRVLGL
ncbi:acyl-CoA dehydrogenase family protein [Sphingorhabdus sp. 109]|jgi:alkylation response protein AidB-like acyl-CoA dehydrogenase|uniref:acyl-CoA dehydrogenase family protein n=1 Tax=Sphingorhabdus sp. 109 TaxID=2653173 RepID=UPI0012F0E4D5|nr:acyl-CoA dehydrogenase family protein [Sphingorhabdus sp. 109]VWX59833.1 Acyl-CoA dehydrogenase [Sphingorhabdus sp. 109]